MTVDGRLHTSEFYVKEEGLYMYCNLFHKYDPKNRQKQSKVWNKEDCNTICKDKLNISHNEHARYCGYVVQVRGSN